MKCSFCGGNGLHGVKGVSIQSATTRQDGRVPEMIEGKSCALCGHWVEAPVTPVCQFNPKAKPSQFKPEHATGQNTKQRGEEILTAMRENIGKISELRRLSVSWCKISDIFPSLGNNYGTLNKYYVKASGEAAKRDKLIDKEEL
jgi:hypothetical protein